VAKVYLFLADGFEEIEGLTVVDLLRRAGIEIVMVSVNGNIEVTGSHQITTKADVIFEEVDFADADMLVLPGGMPGTNHLKEHEGLDRLLKEFHSKGKKLSAICAAPSVLGSKGLLKGKKATCYPGHESSLIDAQVMNTAVVEDGNIITSRGMGTSIDFSLALIKNIAGEAEAAKIASAIQYEHFKS
jgi:4-methyl-5(b-hydroxyethyl)-thiazole monophosphate biosynthesis